MRQYSCVADQAIKEDEAGMPVEVLDWEVTGQQLLQKRTHHAPKKLLKLIEHRPIM